MPPSTHVGLCLIGLSGLVACAEPAPPPAPVIRPVRHQLIHKVSGQQNRTYAGATRADVSARLSFRVGGSLRTLHVKVGDQVKSGDLIAELDPRDFNLQLKEARAALANARAQSRNAQAGYSRARKLYETRAASKQDLDGARAAADSARAQMASLSQRVEMARTQVGYTRLTSPVDGAIASVTVEPNENVAPGQAIAQLSAGQRPEVEVQVPESAISGVQQGMAVQISISALKNRTFEGKVKEVGVSPVGQRTTFPVTVQFDADEPGVRPGMAAEVTFAFGQAEATGRIYVPPFAVGHDGEGHHVYLVNDVQDEVGTIERRGVQVGAISSHGLEIADGLAEGERLVVAGVHFVRPGQKVKVPPEQEVKR